MDPNQALKEIESRLLDLSYQNIKECNEFCLDLDGWLSNNGFEPKWTDYKNATDYYTAWKESKPGSMFK